MSGPRRISDREIPLSLTGYFVPTSEPNAPLLIGMPDTDDLFVFAFSTEDKLREVMEDFGLAYARIAKVTDGRELIAEINVANAQGWRPYRVRLAVDPYRADNGRARFVEPQLDPPPAPPGPVSPSALATMKHADGCQVVRENGIAVWTCVGDCPAMYEFIRSGQVDHQPWEQLNEAQTETVKRTVTARALSDLGEETK